MSTHKVTDTDMIAATRTATYNTSVLRLACRSDNAITRLTDRYHDAPLKVTKTFVEESTGALMLILMDVSPGMMDGDRYEAHVDVGHQCHLMLTNQSFTKVHPAPRIGSVAQYDFLVGEGAILEYFPEPTIPYADSRLHSRTRFHLSAGATLLYADILTPGRMQSGEKFQYQSITSELEIVRDNKLLAWDRFQLMPSVHRYSAVGAMEHYTHSGTFWIIADGADQRLLDRLRGMLPAQPDDELLVAASQTAGQGIVVRMLGMSAWQLQALISSLWAECRRFLWSYPPGNFRK